MSTKKDLIKTYSKIKNKVNSVLDRAEKYGGSLGSVNLSNEEKQKRQEQMNLINKTNQAYKLKKYTEQKAKEQAQKIKGLKPKDYNVINNRA